MSRTHDELVTVEVELPGGALELRQPPEWADLPDDRSFEWAPMAPYWTVMWRSGLALARRTAGLELAGLRVIEVGCGLGLPSLAAARRGAEVVATDADADALELVELNADANGLALETRVFDFIEGEPPGRFDLALAADVLYEEDTAGQLLAMLPRLAPRAIVASPERKQFTRFAAEARSRWPVSSERDDVVEMLELELG